MARVRRNTSEKMGREIHQRRESVNELRGGNFRYIATLVNPVDHRLYDVVFAKGAEKVHVVAPIPNDEYDDDSKRVYSYGDGYLDDDDKVEEEESGVDLARSHTPSGVGKKGSGQGLMLYCGLALYAKYRGLGGIYSSLQGRSGAATSWWRSQVDRGFASSDNKYVQGHADIDVEIDNKLDADDLPYDTFEASDAVEEISIIDVDPSVVTVSVTAEGRLEIQYITAEKVADSGYVVAWDEDDQDLQDLFEDYGKAQPPEVILGLDLSTTADPMLVAGFLDDLEEAGVGSDKIVKFLDGVPKRLLKPLGSRVRELYGQQKLPFKDDDDDDEMAANPGKHSKAWLSFFGEGVRSN